MKNINLIVGLNGMGKSRVLRVINALALVFFNSQKVPFEQGYFYAIFENDEHQEIHYEVDIFDSVVRKEFLKINNDDVLERDHTGFGKIRNEEIGNKISFQIPTNQAAVTRRDSLQYPFLEVLYKWANSVRYFRFNQENIKNNLVIRDENKSPEEEFNLRETDKVIRAFSSGIAKFGEVFQNKIIGDFNSIGYNISRIYLGPLGSLKFESNAGNVIIGLNVQEIDLNGPTDQISMSDGMFRALSIIIHMNLYELERHPICIMVDDIGEGLDFERATSIIKLLISRAELNNFQLIVTSNDKFIMNNIDLEYWNLIMRKGSTVSLINKQNSPTVFEEFKFTGLSNFDFFSSKFFKSNFENN